jgi:hypothetical protein
MELAGAMPFPCHSHPPDMVKLVVSHGFAIKLSGINSQYVRQPENITPKYPMVELEELFDRRDVGIQDKHLRFAH